MPFPDRCDILQDNAAAGASDPSYTGAKFKEGVVCNIKAVGGDESYRGRQLEGHLSHVVMLPNMTGLTNAMQLSITTGLFNGRTLDIQHIRPKNEPGKPPLLEAYCVETRT